MDAVRDKRTVRLQETRPTTEGDPIVSVYATQREGWVLVTRDTTQDKFGNYGIVREKCWEPRPTGGDLMFSAANPPEMGSDTLKRPESPVERRNRPAEG